MRQAAAARLGLGLATASRRLGLGAGSVIGGRVTMALDASALEGLCKGHRLALVSGTNGKTTTTALLSAALRTAGPVLTNSDGSNLPAGLVAELCRAPTGVPGVLEVDEAWLGTVAGAARPRVVVLLNLSRDQLDRVSEVRRLGISWREMTARLVDCEVVANADDPLVAWAASGSSQVTWVAAGSSWRLDSSGCPSCGARIDFQAGCWACLTCGLARPEPVAWVDDGELVLASGRRFGLSLALPGGFNLTNAAMAGLAAQRMGVALEDGLAAMAELSSVAGRYQVIDLPGAPSRRARLLLAKNPAGWTELLDLLDRPGEPPAPVVIAINSRIADGRDPSWLWDVPFERLAGRHAVATGERCADLAVRLAYAGVDHQTEADPLRALARAAGASGAHQVIDVAANYTAFQGIRKLASRQRA